jgi:hypothetical protein
MALPASTEAPDAGLELTLRGAAEGDNPSNRPIPVAAIVVRAEVGRKESIAKGIQHEIILSAHFCELHDIDL